MKTASLADVCHSFAPLAGMEVTLSRSAKERVGYRFVWRLAALFPALLLLFSACTSQSNKPAEPEKAEKKGPELITARSAFQKLYVAARGWNQDAKPYRLA